MILGKHLWYDIHGVDTMQNLKKTNTRRLRWYIICMLCVLLFVMNILLYLNIKSIFPDALNKGNITASTKPTLSKKQQTIQTGLANMQIKSAYGLLIDLEDGNVLYDKKSNEQMYPASMTKVLTALTALDNIHNLNERVTIQPEDIKGLYEVGASVAGLQINDSITYEQLLYALILPSGADAANVLARYVSGNTENFVIDMNKKANAMGMKNSNFTNTTGLHAKDHYTTLQDMRKMMVYVWKNPVLKKVLTTIHDTITNLNKNAKSLNISSTLYTYTKDLSFLGGKIIGGKSGYTPEAGSCLISIGELNNGRLYMFISGQAPGIPRIQPYHMDDAKYVYANIAKLYSE